MSSRMIIAAVGVLLVSGCAPGTAAPVTPDPAAVSQGRELLDHILLSLSGTPAQRLAKEKAGVAVRQEALAACITGKGFPYAMMLPTQQGDHPLGFRDFASLAPLGLGHFGYAAALRREGRTDDGLYRAERTHPVPHEQRFVYGKAVRDCRRDAPPEYVPRPPEGTIQLAGELEETFTAVEKSPAVAAALGSYATRWLEAVAFEKQAAGADTLCRRPAQEYALATAAPLLQQFIKKYETQLEAARTGWTRNS